MPCEYPTYVLQELPDVTDYLNYPIQNVQRIKYTCFDVSKTLIGVGATSGGIYVFNRDPCEFIQLIPNKDGTITRLAISPDEKRIAFANGRGTVTVADCDQSRGHSVTSKEHKGNEVTAMLWGNNNMLYVGDDIGRISVLQLQSFIAKTMFQSLSQMIMSLDSRICQLDTTDCLLLVSTLTRTYICDTSQEQYRQIGQKTRDGEYGACFVDRGNAKDNNQKQNAELDLTEFKKYSIVDNDTGFAVGKKLENTIIYCARPSSRLWEANVDGTVIRTHQFKQVLGKKPMKILSAEAYANESVVLQKNEIQDDSLSVNFPKVYSINGAIFSYRKNSLYFLNVDDLDNSLWFEISRDILECKIVGDIVYAWTADSSLRILRFLHIDKYLIKCYIDEKYELCRNLCDMLSNYLLYSTISRKLHLLAGLKSKITDEKLKNIHNILERFETLKSNEATLMKSGIYVVDNTFNAQSLLNETINNTKHIDEQKFTTISPEALQTLKGLSVSVTDKFTSSKKMLKEKWDEYEKKHRGSEKPNLQEIIVPKKVYNNNLEQTETLENTEIVYKESSQDAIVINLEDESIENKLCKTLYQYFRLKLVGKEDEVSNLPSIIESYSCDITMIYALILQLEQYCLTIGAIEESKLIPNNIFLNYLNETTRKDEYLNAIINDGVLYKYFVDSCIIANVSTQKLSNLACECGFPLPYNKTNKKPAFSELIDVFIEKQWLSQSRNQCYDICKRMPYLWRKILYLRRNEDLLNILTLMLQMLDETLLHSFLPQFTLDTWDAAIKLYATLQANVCLNCNKKFDNICVKEALSWDDIGALLIKSIGGKNAIKLMDKHGDLIPTGDLTMKFYHTSLLASIYETVDANIVCTLVDAVYSSYNFEISRIQICNILQTTKGRIKNTSLPIEVAAISKHWGLTPLTQDNITLKDIVDNIPTITKGVIDCVLCGLPLQNEVLIKDGGLWTFMCGHTFHGACLDLVKVMLCTVCLPLNS